MSEKVSFLDQALLPQAHAMKTLAIVALSVAAAVLVGSTVYNGGDNFKQGWNKISGGAHAIGSGAGNIMGVGVEEEAPAHRK
jgi:hypothetical protein